MSPLQRPVTGWRLSLAQLLGEPLPELPAIPGRQVRASDIEPPGRTTDAPAKGVGTTDTHPIPKPL